MIRVGILVPPVRGGEFLRRALARLRRGGGEATVLVITDDQGSLPEVLPPHADSLQVPSGGRELALGALEAFRPDAILAGGGGFGEEEGLAESLQARYGPLVSVLHPRDPAPPSS